MKKVVILIDGQNLFYALKNQNLKETEIEWSSLFNSLLEDEDELIRTYWFRPQKIQDSHLSPDNIRKQIAYKKYANYYQDYKNGNTGAIPNKILHRIESDAKEAIDWLNYQKERFAGIEFIYDQLCLEHSDIEIIKTGIVKVNPYNQQYLGEKGVDIALAVRMIALSVEKRCDKIILLSGDYDYAEAIKYVKNNMTKIHIVKIHKGHPPKNRNMSRDLSVMADKIIDLYEEDIKNKYLNPVQQS